MPESGTRRSLLALIAVSALLLTAWLVLAAGAPSGAASGAVPSARSTAPARSGAALGPSRAALAAVEWRGGPVTASTGDVLQVFVSESLPVETATTPEQWAEFLVGLTHGSELSQLTSYFAPLVEVQEICGERTLGCYQRNELVSLAEPAGEGAIPEEVARHEYGHHVASHRSNQPWTAIDWGPKRWASTVNVCARVSRSEAFPGDQRGNYSRNPGEAWAEVYRLMDERRAGITTANWQIIDPGFYPGEAALQAAEQDVLQPWAHGRPAAYRKVFGKKTKKVWSIPLRTPLDGDVRVTVTFPRNGKHEIALLAPNRRTVIARGQSVGPRSKTLVATACGQRTLHLRVAQRGVLGLVRVTASTP
ncbi:MAG TPA: hypothetical protein VI540_08495 [Gaiellaceae bacterium]|nr:hypothetical protein [Gaiellaceae bacterium]